MIGLELPDYARLSPRVATVLGQNPSPFTGPGTNTYLLGTGRRPLLLDTGQGVAIYADLLTRALAELCDTDRIDRIVLTHAHVDHIGGVGQVRERFGPLAAFKKPWPGHDAAGEPLTPIDHGAEIAGEDVTLVGIFTPGHAPDHLCYYLKEERALFTGDVVLGAGTTVIPEDTGDLGQYMDSLRRLLELDVATIYPAHGPAIHEPPKKSANISRIASCARIRCWLRSRDGPLEAMAIVKRIYTDVPEYLHPAAASSVRSHLKKLRNEGARCQSMRTAGPSTERAAALAIGLPLLALALVVRPPASRAQDSGAIAEATPAGHGAGRARGDRARGDAARTVPPDAPECRLRPARWRRAWRRPRLRLEPRLPRRTPAPSRFRPRKPASPPSLQVDVTTDPADGAALNGAPDQGAVGNKDAEEYQNAQNPPPAPHLHSLREFLSEGDRHFADRA